MMVQASFNLAIVITLLATSLLIERINRLRVIYVCSIVNSAMTALLFIVPTDILRLLFILVVAVFFSVGQLAFLTYFWSLTVPEERGRVAGLLGFGSLTVNLVVYTLVGGYLDFNRIVVLGVLLSLAPLLVIFLRPTKAQLTAKRYARESYPEKRTVLLYLIPWVLFSLINSTLAKNTSFHISQQITPDFYLSLTVLQVAATILGALFGGIIADFLGRRVSLAFSLTLYGISSALAGMGNTGLLFFVYFANGLSWGILLVMYSFVIWGDLANTKNCAKMYAIGFMSFYVAQSIGFFPLEQVFQISLAVSSLVSCLIIFMSNIPIFIAPELLSSDFTEKLRMKLHLNTIKKIKRAPNQG
jgi:MFS family permease